MVANSISAEPDSSRSPRTVNASQVDLSRTIVSIVIASLIDRLPPHLCATLAADRAISLVIHPGPESAVNPLINDATRPTRDVREEEAAVRHEYSIRLLLQGSAPSPHQNDR